MKMKFRNFVFPSNPKSIEISASTNFKQRPIYNSDCNVQNVSVNPVIVKGSGEFYGERAEEGCSYLQHMLRTRAAGILLLPSSVSLTAYLTDFTFSKDAQKGSIAYSFTFTECCCGKMEQREYCFTIAKQGENAFVIAGRCGVSVNDIMKYNDFKTPFDIKEGDRVVLR